MDSQTKIKVALKNLCPDYVGEDIELTSEEKKKLEDVCAEFRREDHKQEMRAIRHHDVCGYEDGETELFLKNVDKDSVESQVIANIESKALQMAMNALSDEQRERVILYYFYGKSEAEIAQILDVSQSSISRSLKVCLKKLKEILETDA